MTNSAKNCFVMPTNYSTMLVKRDNPSVLTHLLRFRIIKEQTQIFDILALPVIFSIEKQPLSFSLALGLIKNI